ncbi:thiamine pyrophosphate-binding protein [Saliphagus sp. LR7]|uniref:thiamine pyrophosphate-binding protein n=1 Tax=Saliphagus sp. LR7 TaxID=2282654 RepID=UPI000DF7FB13|nr:thiamine pyrophosphate-binding protein [Saliphagus sp. LR7]
MTDRTRSGGEYVYEALCEAGIGLLVGLPGTQTLPLDRVVARRSEMRYVMARHETAIPHIAWGYYESSGTPAATLTVPGPGETNAMHGLKNAYEDSVPIVHVGADVDPADRGKGPIHEIDPGTYDTVVKENVVVESGSDLPAAVARGIERALAPPMGPVRLGVPSGILASELSAPAASVEPERITRENASALEAAADILADADRPVLYAGGGCRRSEGGADALRDLADRLGAPVATTYKGKGLFPEDDPRALGVTGSHLPPGSRAVLEAADAVLALGTDFDGVTTDGWALPMGDSLIHVTLDPDAIGASYEPEIGVVADAGEAAREIHDRLPEEAAGWDGSEVARAAREEYVRRLEHEGLLEDTPPLNTPAVLRTVRESTPRESIVTVDVGGFRLWAMQAFESYEPEGFVAAGSWAGMGVGLPAAIGAKLANPDRPVVCLSGDGGLMMCVHELHTAAEEDLDIVLVVSNNEDYGVISKSPEIMAETGDHEFVWDSPSFPTIAEGFGWDGRSADTADELAREVGAAIDRDGPTLIDVEIPTEEPSASEAAEFESELEF